MLGLPHLAKRCHRHIGTASRGLPSVALALVHRRRRCDTVFWLPVLTALLFWQNPFRDFSGREPETLCRLRRLTEDNRRILLEERLLVLASASPATLGTPTGPADSNNENV